MAEKSSGCNINIKKNKEVLEALVGQTRLESGATLAGAQATNPMLVLQTNPHSAEQIVKIMAATAPVHARLFDDLTRTMSIMRKMLFRLPFPSLAIWKI